MRLIAGCIGALTAVVFAPFALACSPQFPSEGLPGRVAEIEFSNRSGEGQHEYWAPKNARLIMQAAFVGISDEYDHNILGGAKDAKGLTIHIHRPGSDKISCPSEVILPADEVFEDIAPRLADVTGDGLPEVIVVHTDIRLGARITIYNRRAKRIAETPYIGQTHRWLAPVGAADLDGDGQIEIAYIDRPHLAKTLRIWRFVDGGLTHVADQPGLTNHKIGWDHIPGGIRTCQGKAEIITASADWSRIMATTLENGSIQTMDIGAYTGVDSLNAVLTCP